MTPATLAKANQEHSHQRALFAWLNMAARYGFAAAWDEQSYTVTNHARDYYVVPGVELQQPALTRAHAIANGGQRDKITAGKLKAEGVKPGVPDIFLPLPLYVRSNPLGQQPYCGLYIEMKRPQVGRDQRSGATSLVQQDWIAYLRSVGYAVSVCFDWIAAAKDIQSYVEACGG